MSWLFGGLLQFFLCPIVGQIYVLRVRNKDTCAAEGADCKGENLLSSLQSSAHQEPWFFILCHDLDFERHDRQVLSAVSWSDAGPSNMMTRPWNTLSKPRTRSRSRRATWKGFDKRRRSIHRSGCPRFCNLSFMCAWLTCESSRIYICKN